MQALTPILDRFRRWRSGAADFATQSNGSVLLESAFLIPVLLLLLMGGIEVSRFILLDQKIARVASNAADLTSRTVDPSTADINQVFSAVEYIAEPFELGDEDLVIISSVSRPVGADSNQMDWQLTGGGGGSKPSRVGVVGGDPNLPDVVVLREGQGIIVGEAFYTYEPFFFDGFIDSKTVYHAAFYRPRDISFTLRDDFTPPDPDPDPDPDPPPPPPPTDDD